MSDAPRLIQERHGEVLKLAIANPAARNALHPDIYREGVAARREAADCREGIKAFFEKRKPQFNKPGA